MWLLRHETNYARRTYTSRDIFPEIPCNLKEDKYAKCGKAEKV